MKTRALIVGAICLLPPGRLAGQRVERPSGLDQRGTDTTRAPWSHRHSVMTRAGTGLAGAVAGAAFGAFALHNLSACRRRLDECSHLGAALVAPYALMLGVSWPELGSTCPGGDRFLRAALGALVGLPLAGATGDIGTGAVVGGLGGSLGAAWLVSRCRARCPARQVPATSPGRRRAPPNRRLQWPREW